MTDRNALAEEIFAEALDLPHGPRTAFITSRCHNDPALLSQVRSLLDDAGQLNDAFLNPNEIRQLTAAGAGFQRLDDEPVLPNGSVLGGYVIRGVLGAGGMGLVYRAEQDRPRRTVALKVIRRGLGVRGILRRFEQEADVLGRLQHPGIAQIYEAGTAKLDALDQPYIAMELVEGPNLTAYAARADLGTAQRLRLLAAVCDAVHHAHQRGIIHRDLKPGNILVNSAGEPKVLDFGVARAVAGADPQLTTHRTHIGQLIGTLAYMSPEQVIGNPADIDVRSDVYSLGVILYELLTGRLPLDISSRSIPEAARIIREDAPTKLSHVSRVFRGEVDTIVHKAMDKDLTRRYQSAAELAGDIRRHLEGEPILARNDSALYVLRKQLRRYRWAVMGAAVFLIGLLGFAIHADITARTERRLGIEAASARAEAFVERDRARESSRLLTSELRQARVDRGRLEVALGNIAAAEDVLWTEYLADPNWPPARWALWEMYNTAPVLWTRAGLPQPVAVATAPDGSRAAMISRSGVLAVVDTASGTELSRRDTKITAPARLCFLPDLRACVVGTAKGGLDLVPLDPDAPVVPIGPQAVHVGGVTAIAVSPKGDFIATGGVDKRVRLWDAATLRLIHEWSPHELPISALAFNRDASLLATAPKGSTDCPVASLWSLPGADLVRTYQTIGHSDTTALYFNPTGNAVISAGVDRRVCLLPVALNDEPRVLAELAYSPLMSRAGPTGAIAVADTLGLSIIEPSSVVRRTGLGPSRRGHLGLVFTDASTVTQFTNDGNIFGISTRDQPALTRLGGFVTWCFGVSFAPDSSRLVIAPGWGNGTSIPEIVSLPDTAYRLSLNWPAKGVRTRCARFLGDGSSVALGSADGMIRIFDVHSAGLVSSWKSAPGEIYALDVCRDKPLIAAGHTSGALRVWNLDSHELVLDLGRSTGRIEGVAFSPDCSLLAATGAGANVNLFDLSTGTLLGALECSDNAWSVALSPDAGTIIAGTHAGTIEVFDIATRTRLAAIKAHGRLIPGLAFSADGSLFASGSEDGAIKLWDAKSFRELLALRPGGGEVVEVAFDRSQRYLAGACARGFVALYDLHAMDPCIPGNIDYQRARLKIPDPAAATAP